MTKKLNDKAINIKGKQYVLVSDRVLFFNEAFPKGSITTELISNATDKLVVIKATVKPDAESGRVFTAYSQATWGDGYINKTSAIENAETSAVGRALGFMGIGVIESIASADEMRKADHPVESSSEHPGPKPRELDFTEYQLKLESTGTTEQLKEVWASLPVEAKNALGALKDQLKKKYEDLKI
jgi:hypothetical protein